MAVPSPTQPALARPGAAQPSPAAPPAASAAARVPAPPTIEEPRRRSLLLPLAGALIAVVIVVVAVVAFRDRIMLILGGTDGTAAATARTPSTLTTPLPTYTPGAQASVAPTTTATGALALPATSTITPPTIASKPSATMMTAAASTSAAPSGPSQSASPAATSQPVPADENGATVRPSPGTPDATAGGSIATDTAEATKSTPTPQAVDGKVTNAIGARLRAQPSTAAEITLNMVQDEQFQVLAWADLLPEPAGCTWGLWLQAKLPQGGPQGWICGDAYLVQVKDAQGVYQAVTREFLIGSGLPKINP